MDVSVGVSGTLRAQMDGHPPCVLESHPMDGRIKIDKSGSVQTLTSRMGTGGMNVPLLLKMQETPPKTCSVTMGSYTQVNEEQAPTLMARDFKDPAAVNQGYRVRKLTATECAKLQGFPAWWCSGLETPEPTEEDIAFWSEVWETHRRIAGRSTRPKSRNQIIKWLKNPYSEAAEYAMWGNGVALPNVFFVLAGIVWAAQTDGG